jgi:predicted acyl esterase
MPFRRGKFLLAEMARSVSCDILDFAEKMMINRVTPEEVSMRTVRKTASALVLFAIASLVFVPRFGAAPQRQRPDFSALFNKTEVMIPMRDGVKLHTEVYTPKNTTAPLPILMNRTPYGIASSDKGISGMIYRYSDMVPEGYIFAFQDIRGRYGSEGKFVMLRPLHDPNDPKGVDESTDTYDTIDWLVKNVPNNNGRVGLDGISYDGFLVTMGMINPHPALKAVSEQACMGDTWLGDDFFHNGAFRLSYAFEYTALLESSNENFSFAFDRFDVYDFYLRLGALSNANTKYFHGKLPTWNEFVAHASYDDFWKRLAVAYGLKQPTVPNLNVAGWWDQEDFYGPMATYARLEKSDSKHLNYLVAGPWNHGGWGGGSGKSLGEIPFGSDTSVYFRQKIEVPRAKALCRSRKRYFSRLGATTGFISIPGLHARRKLSTSISARMENFLSMLRKRIPLTPPTVT